MATLDARSVALVAWCLFSSTGHAAAPVLAPEVVNPRPFGHAIGEVLEQKIAIVAPRPLTLVAESLPKAGRTGAWLERRGAEVKSRRSGTGTAYEITLKYQIVNAPPELTTLALPALTLV